MTAVLLQIISILQYVFLLSFGVFVSAAFIGIPNTKRNVLILSSLSTLLLGIEGIVLFSSNLQMVEFLYPLITHLPLALFLILYFKKRPFMVLLGITIAYLCCQVVNWFILLIDLLRIDKTALELLYIVLLLVFGYFLIHHIAGYIFALLEKSTRDLLVFSIVPIVYYLYDYLSVVYTEHLYNADKVTLEFLPFFICISYLIVSIDYFKEYEQRILAERNTQLMNIQITQYENLCERIAETRRARHDLRQHLRLIQAYIDNGDGIALQDYIRTYGQKLSFDLERRYCENEVANTVVSFYAKKAEEHNIHFDSRLSLPSKLPIAAPDLCALLGNLLENALESCSNHPPDICTICISGQLRGSRTLVITMDNTPALEPKKMSGFLLSTKHGGSGIGTASIKNIAMRYCGEASFEYKNGTFFSSVILTLPSDQ